MLYPKEDRRNLVLYLACRNCDYQEESKTNEVYQNNILFMPTERKHAVQGLASDPALPRTNKKSCPKCGHNDLVFYQSHDRRRDTPMTLNFVCANPSCNFLWNDLNRAPGIEVMEQKKGGQREPRQNDSAFEISKLMDKDVLVELSSGRHLSGRLKGYDYISNMVLDSAVETDSNSGTLMHILSLTGHSRKLGLIVIKGSQVTSIHPAANYVAIPNPFE